MNKEELIKIFSAYLPYGLRGRYNLPKWQYQEGLEIKEYPLQLESFERFVEGFYIPILYDLSYLTNEIEHKGERFVPLHRILEEYCFDLSKMDEEEILSYKDSLIDVDMSYKTAQMLLSWHFNIFQLPEDQFINKATLNK